jgi:hypothetical protein
MPGWTSDELDRVGSADELRITSARADGTLRPYVPIWVVRVGDELYVRSYRGTEGGWFRHLRERDRGRIQAGGVDREVTVAAAADGVGDAVDCGIPQQVRPVRKPPRRPHDRSPGPGDRPPAGATELAVASGPAR